MADLPPGLDPTIAEYYSRVPEEDRLTQGAFQLEAIRTRQLILELGPPPPAMVVDIGGGAGAYSFWLAEQGFSVHLLDASPRLIEEARRREAAGTPLASIRVGDARALPFADRSATIVLLLGPLYHLTEAADRVHALTEARRVLEPGGVLFAAGISRWASALDGLARDLLHDPAFAAIVQRDITEGQHRNPTERLDYFTTAFFHRPDELRAEVLGAGFAQCRVYGIEGPGWILPDVSARMHDPERRAALLKVAELLQSEPSMSGISAHLLAVAR